MEKHSDFELYCGFFVLGANNSEEQCMDDESKQKKPQEEEQSQGVRCTEDMLMILKADNVVLLSGFCAGT